MSAEPKQPKPRQTDKWSSAHRVASGLQIHESRNGNYVRGTVRTPHGYVLVYSQGLQYLGPTPLARATADKPEYVPLLITNLSIILDGREKERVIEAAYSEKRLVTIAREFAVEAAREAARQKEKETN